MVNLENLENGDQIEIFGKTYEFIRYLKVSDIVEYKSKSIIHQMSAATFLEKKPELI